MFILKAGFRTQMLSYVGIGKNKVDNVFKYFMGNNINTLKKYFNTLKLLFLVIFLYVEDTFLNTKIYL